jgi:GTPase KRas protein
VLSEFRDAILQVKDKEAFPIVLVANKIDLNREVSTSEGLAIAKSWNVPYIETSAKEGVGVEDAFMTLLKEIRNAQPKEPEKKARRRGCTIL